ncbi:MAG: DUF1905 domain-containing protein, partial [Anaerolineales bacterium]|nr:DUF1905 domain-containing protein [Anaerolineales bacterium]
TFNAIVTQAEGKKATGIPVPGNAVAALGNSKRPKVVVNLNGYSYRSTVAAYGDVFMLPLSAEHREAAGLQAGDEVEVTLELDETPRIVALPADLTAALAEHDLLTLFEGLSYSVRKEHVRQVESAKAEETRQRRISKIITTLSAKR